MDIEPLPKVTFLPAQLTELVIKNWTGDIIDYEKNGQVSTRSRCGQQLNTYAIERNRHLMSRLDGSLSRLHSQMTPTTKEDEESTS